MIGPAADYLSDAEVRELICDLCRHFYQLGWASGTGGGISIRQRDQIYMAPSGVQKERLEPQDIFVLDQTGEVVQNPGTDFKVSECQPLFMNAYRLRDAGAVLHSHSLNAMAATLIYDSTFKVSNLEMMKGIQGVGVFESHEVPIIANTAREADLANSMAAAIKAYPEANAVLVRGHGVYVWGETWAQAKTQAECYDYLFAAAVKIKELGLNPETGGQG